MISRRTFIQHAGVLASAPMVWSGNQTRSRYKLGLQLYTMRAAMARDMDDTLRRIAAMGYEEVETYGFDSQGIGYYGLPAKVFAQRLRDYKLTSPSGHYDLNRFAGGSEDDLKRYVDRCIEGAHALGQQYITWPLLDADFRTIDKFKVAAERLNLAGAPIRRAGLQLAYHNHDFEFVEQNGQIGYDIIIRETDPSLVKLQMDLYWIAHGSKLTAREWFERQPGRFVMWHVKDMHRTSRDYTEVGNGTIDFTAIWPHALLAGLKHFFVEQGGNFTHDPFRSVADSAEYVKRVLLK
ncbi:MAG TPA: sugar phosphate isomerase/epimerase [Vicinamibacterales bacterium]|nr:sugar phosphate isomerase/epimerase [Vicinamibacterales bacterium]